MGYMIVFMNNWNYSSSICLNQFLLAGQTQTVAAQEEERQKYARDLAYHLYGKSDNGDSLQYHRCRHITRVRGQLVLSVNCNRCERQYDNMMWYNSYHYNARIMYIIVAYLRHAFLQMIAQPHTAPFGLVWG